MNAMRLLLLTLGSGIVLISSALAEDQPRTARAPSPKADVKRDADAQGVRSARSLLGTSIKTPAGDEFGTIKDVGLDLDQARVTAVFVTPHDAAGGTREAVAIPLTALQWRSGRGNIVFDAASKTTSETAAPDDPGQKSRVMRLAATGDIPVTNADGDHAGRVVDFGITSTKGAITYAVFTPRPEGQSDETLYPIPLAAFVVPAEAKTWILDLPEDILENTPTFVKSPWPDRVPLAWTEYVNVRYGRPPSGGVQSKVHVPNAK